MKTQVIAGILTIGCFSCERKEEPSMESRPPAASSSKKVETLATAAEEAGGAAPSLATKTRIIPPASERNKPPVAEPVPGQPGMVKSPFNGKLIDVRGIPAGVLVADPTYPSDRKKHFRVPEVPGSPKLVFSDPDVEETPEMASAPVGRAVPGKEGFVFSPYTNQIIDVTGFTPGALVMEPGASEEGARYIRIPGEPATEEGAAE